MAQITGHKIIKEPVQITVDNSVIWNMVRDICMRSVPSGEIRNGALYGFTINSPTIKTFIRTALDSEIELIKALDLVEEKFFENCDG